MDKAIEKKWQEWFAIASDPGRNGNVQKDMPEVSSVSRKSFEAGF